MKFHRAPHTFVGQVQLKVQNLNRSLSFYQDVIGFKVMERTESKAVLSADGKTPLVIIEQPEGVEARQGRTTGLYHYAILLPERSDLARIVQHFLDIGLRFGSSDHLVSEAIYLSDPDGNGIEIYRDRSDAEWNWHHGEVEMAVDPLNFKDLLSTEVKAPWNGLPESTVMGHIHLHVAELRDTEVFYTQGLGFEVVNRYGGQALFISSGGYHHHIGLNTWNGIGAPKPPDNSAGMRCFTLQYANAAERDHAVSRLRELGAPVKEEAGRVMTCDPSGNDIHLVI